MLKICLTLILEKNNSSTQSTFILIRTCSRFCVSDGQIQDPTRLFNICTLILANNNFYTRTTFRLIWTWSRFCVSDGQIQDSTRHFSICTLILANNNYFIALLLKIRFSLPAKRDETAIFNPRGETLKVGWQTALSSRFTGTENQILETVAVKNSIHYSKQNTANATRVTAALALLGQQTSHLFAIAVFRPL